MALASLSEYSDSVSQWWLTTAVTPVLRDLMPSSDSFHVYKNPKDI